MENCETGKTSTKKARLALCVAVVICSAGLAHAGSSLTERQCTPPYDPNVLETDQYRITANCAAARGDMVVADELRRRATWLEGEWRRVEAQQKMEKANFDAGERRDREWMAKQQALKAKNCTGGILAIGGSKMDAIHAWCYPWSVNTSESASSKREQWVYRHDMFGDHEGYLYFENGVLVAIQRNGG
jgi:hypothetical protein